MEATAATDMRFREGYHAGLEAVAEMAGAATALRTAYIAAFRRGNPRWALKILRDLAARSDLAARRAHDYRAHVLGLMVEIEAGMGAEESTNNTGK